MRLQEALKVGCLLGYDVRLPNDVFGSDPPIRTLDHNLWESPLAEEWLVASPPPTDTLVEGHLVIAVVRWMPDAGAHDATSPENPDTWEFLGFDITDESFTSGLHNCSLVDEDHWLFSSLNLNRLIPSLDLAQRFRHECDCEAPEHAPFFVNGVWVLHPDLQGAKTTQTGAESFTRDPVG